MARKESQEFVAVARIIRPRGRRGEVVAEMLTDFPRRFRQLSRVFLENRGQGSEPVTLEEAWLHKERVVLKFSGVDSIEQAEALRDLHVLVRPEERMPLAPDRYYIGDLLGCRVFRELKGVLSEVGTVTGVEPTGGVDLLQVSRSKGNGGEVLIPLAQAICTRIDLERKTIVIEPPEDLLELNL